MTRGLPLVFVEWPQKHWMCRKVASHQPQDPDYQWRGLLRHPDSFDVLKPKHKAWCYSLLHFHLDAIFFKFLCSTLITGPVSLPIAHRHYIYLVTCHLGHTHLCFQQILYREHFTNAGKYLSLTIPILNWLHGITCLLVRIRLLLFFMYHATCCECQSACYRKIKYVMHIWHMATLSVSLYLSVSFYLSVCLSLSLE